MKMQVPEGCPGISLMGKFYEAVKHVAGEIEKFIVDIPSEFKAIAESHGFTEHVEEPSAADATADQKQRKSKAADTGVPKAE